jgi:putative ABC transport system substrate-binding protein
VRRRGFIAGLVVATVTGHARAQQTTKVNRIAIVHPSDSVADLTETGGLRHYRALFEELRRMGYIEGQNLLIDRYSGEGRAENYPELAHKVVGLNPRLIVAVGRLVRDIKAATTTIPIVAISADPVANGLVSNLARPGGNITGVSIDAGPEIQGKRLEFLHDVVPRVSKVAYLASRSVWDTGYGAPMREAAMRTGVFLIGAPFDGPFNEAEYRRVFAAMAQAGAEALVVVDQTENFTNRRLIVELAAKGRLPAIYPYREHVELGGFMAYTSDRPDLFRHAANEIDQIFRGTWPGDIPFYQPIKFELVINLKTAKTLGLTIPLALLARADEVIE